MSGRPLLLSYLLTVLLGAAGPMRAAEVPVPPLEIEANQVEINDKTGISVYKGDVRVTRGAMHLSCATLTVHHIRGEIRQSVCDGRPAKFRRDAGDGKKEVHGHANRVDYYLDDEHVVLLGDAFLEQESDTFTGQHIVYYISRDLVHAGTPDRNGGRVHITIHPKEGNGVKGKGAR